MKYGGRYERNKDYCRLGLDYDSVTGMMKALKVFISWSLWADGIQVVRVENRFVEPSRLGWRDLSLLLQVVVPSTGQRHLMELQLQLTGLSEIRDATHGFYERIRSALPEEVVNLIIDQLTSNTTLDLDLTEEEWLECLKNPEVQKILAALNIPDRLATSAVEIFDSDGNGRVTTAELREGLTLCCDPLEYGDIVDCKLKVRVMQQWLVNRIEPQLRLIQDLLVQRKQHTLKDYEDAVGTTVQNMFEKHLPDFKPSSLSTPVNKQDNSDGMHVNKPSAGELPALLKWTKTEDTPRGSVDEAEIP